jgi:glucose-6-phosphate dehydrogenase assembly protein OpcA
VRRGKTADGPGVVSVELQRKSGSVLLQRPDGRIGTLTQPGQPVRRVALQRRPVADCLAEELRRLDPDEIYESALNGLDKIVRGRVAAPAPAKTREKTRT